MVTAVVASRGTVADFGPGTGALVGPASEPRRLRTRSVRSSGAGPCVRRLHGEERASGRTHSTPAAADAEEGNFA
jgi:hypothetical protein